MIRKLLLAAIAGIALIFLYLVAWPVAVEPVSWTPPASKGYSGAFAPNTDLAEVELLDIGAHDGPEDVVAHEGMIYATSQTGHILVIDPRSGALKVLAQLEGPALGIEIGGIEIGGIERGDQEKGDIENGDFDKRAAAELIVADAYNGLFAVSLTGEVRLLTDHASASDPILYADDLDIMPDGAIIFSDASTRFGAKAAGSTLEASVLEIVEHGRSGRLLKYDPAKAETSIIATGFSFANGVAAGPDGQSVYLAETGEYRILRIWTGGPRAGEREIMIDNLPGMPDNINRGPNDTFLIGLISPRIPILDNLAASPFWRKVIIRLPDFLKPAPAHYGHIVQIDASGRVLNSWQDPKGVYHDTTGAIISDGYLYVTSLTEDNLARKKLDASENGHKKLGAALP